MTSVDLEKNENKLRDDLKSLKRFYQSKENQHTTFLVAIMLGGFWLLSKDETPQYNSLLLFMGVLVTFGVWLLCYDKTKFHNIWRFVSLSGIIGLFIILTIVAPNWNPLISLIDTLKEFLGSDLVKAIRGGSIVLILAIFLGYFATRRSYWERRVVITDAFLGMNVEWSEKLHRDPTGTKFAQAYWSAVEKQSGASHLVGIEMNRQFNGESDMIEGEEKWPTRALFQLVFRRRHSKRFK